MTIKKSEYLKLDNQICFKLYTASRLFTQAYYSILEEMDLTYPQYLILLLLWEHESLTVKELGKFLYLDSGTLTPLLKKMESKELVKRTRDKNDERSVKITLTEKGEALSEKAENIPKEVACKIDMEFSDALMLHSLLEKLIPELKK